MMFFKSSLKVLRNVFSSLSSEHSDWFLMLTQQYFLARQTQRDEPSNVVDYEKIDDDARVSQIIRIFTETYFLSRLPQMLIVVVLFFVDLFHGVTINKMYLMRNPSINKS